MDDKYSDSLPDDSTTRSRCLQNDIAREMQNVDAFFDVMISNNDDDDDDDEGSNETRDADDGVSDGRRSGERCSGGSDVTGANRAVVTGFDGPSAARAKASPSAESIELMRENVELLNAFAVNNETMFGLCTSLQTNVQRLKRTSRTAKATTAVSCPHDDDDGADVRLDGAARGRGAISAAAEPSEGPSRQDKDCCRSADDHRAGRPQRPSCRGGVRTDDDRFYGRDRSAAVSGEFVNADRQQKNVPMSSCAGAAVSSKARAGQRLFRRDGFATSPSSDASVDGSLPRSTQDFIVYDDDDDDYDDEGDEGDGYDEENSACEYDESQDYADHWTNTADRCDRSD